MNNSDKSVRYESSIASFVKYDEAMFHEKFFGAREYADNNYTTVNENPSTGFTGGFKIKSVIEGRDVISSFVGVLNAEGCVEECEILDEDDCERLVCYTTDRTHLKDDVLALGVVDMGQCSHSITDNSNKILYKLNLMNKFGTLTLLQSNLIHDSFQRQDLFFLFY